MPNTSIEETPTEEWVNALKTVQRNEQSSARCSCHQRYLYVTYCFLLLLLLQIIFLTTRTFSTFLSSQLLYRITQPFLLGDFQWMHNYVNESYFQGKIVEIAENLCRGCSGSWPVLSLIIRTLLCIGHHFARGTAFREIAVAVVPSYHFISGFPDLQCSRKLAFETIPNQMIHIRRSMYERIVRVR